MKLKVLVCGAPLSTSGYATHCRVVLDALRIVEDKIDLFLMTYRFAATSNTYEGKNLEWYQHLASKFDPNMVGHFDISIQIGIPTEWRQFGKYNIGVTAGVETLSGPPEWIDGLNAVNKVLTVSSLPAKVLASIKTAEKAVKTKIEVVPFPVKDEQPKQILQLPVESKFTFLSVNQFAPRKNIENMVNWFCQEFKDNEDVGLLLKIYSNSNSTPDYHECKLRLLDILKQHPDRKCKIYFIHGDMNEAEIGTLFLQDSVKAYLSTAHGESFGLSIFDAVCNGIPVVATDYGGYKDFLYQEKAEKSGKSKLKPFFQKVEYDINPVQPNHYMPGIIQPGMLWAYPKEKDFKMKIREVYKDYGRFKKQASELQKLILEKYSKDEINKKYIDILFEDFNLEEAKEQIIEVE
jgi:glycosyltransferase involved in cell wall biosynthesis